VVEKQEESEEGIGLFGGDCNRDNKEAARRTLDGDIVAGLFQFSHRSALITSGLHI
jgi:hypothetical protein